MKPVIPLFPYILLYLTISLLAVVYCVWIGSVYIDALHLDGTKRTVAIAIAVCTGLAIPYLFSRLVPARCPDCRGRVWMDGMGYSLRFKCESCRRRFPL